MKKIIPSAGIIFLAMFLAWTFNSCSKKSPTPSANFSTLNAEITVAQKVLSTISTTLEGIFPGQYPVGSRATLAAAIAAANAIINQGGTAITQSQENAATATLTAAVTTYQNSVNPIDPPGLFMLPELQAVQHCGETEWPIH